jgi:hypothetical protein
MLEILVKVTEKANDYSCSICKLSFPLKHHLTRHYTSRIHLVNTGKAEKWLKCPHCPRTFCRVKVLQTHLAKHSQTKPVCGYCFAAEECSCIATSETPIPKSYQCHICQRLLSCQSALNAHVKTHDPNMKKNFMCKEPGCYKVFSSTKTLSFHFKIKHSPSSPTTYSCSFCKVEFLYKTTRDRHENKIHKEKVQEPQEEIASDCSTILDTPPTKSIEPSIKEALTGFNHPRTSKIGRPFACHASNCFVRFKRIYDLERHWKSVHSEQS